MFIKQSFLYGYELKPVEIIFIVVGKTAINKAIDILILNIRAYRISH